MKTLDDLLRTLDAHPEWGTNLSLKVMDDDEKWGLGLKNIRAEYLSSFTLAMPWLVDTAHNWRELHRKVKIYENGT